MLGAAIIGEGMGSTRRVNVYDFNLIPHAILELLTNGSKPEVHFRAKQKAV